jgi:hypothetical protein
MMRGLPVGGYEITKADKREVYRDAFFSMKLVEAYRSPVLHGYVIEVENLAGPHVCAIAQVSKHYERDAESTNSDRESEKGSFSLLDRIKA